MKRASLPLLLLSFVLLTSCKKDSNSTQPLDSTQVSNTVTSGTWRITYYSNSGQDKTLNYSGYIFTFAGGSVLNAVKTGVSATGAWSSGTDDSEVKLIINFTSPDIFKQISDDWLVTERTDTKITLQDDKSGAAVTDYLTFEKN